MSSEHIRILIVASSPDDRQLLKDLIAQGRWAKKQRAVVFEADTGRTGREFCRKSVPHCVLLDCHLLDMEGVEVLAELRHASGKQAGFPAVVLLTSCGDHATVAEAFRNGAHDFLIRDELTAETLDIAIRNAVAAVRRRERSDAKSRKLERARAQLHDAGEIQKRMLPGSVPQIAGYEIAGICHPAAETGGDFFDYICQADGVAGVVLGDVTGHGLGSALLAADTRAYLRAFSRKESSPGRVIAHTNELLSEDTKGRSFVTLFLAHVRANCSTVRYAAAGHQGYVIRGNGTVTPIDSQQPPLGLAVDMVEGIEDEVTLAAGDLLFLMTDGIYEAVSTHDVPRSRATMFGIPRALQIVCENMDRPAEKIVEELLNRVRHFTPRRLQDDDMTIVVVKAQTIGAP